MFLYKRFNLIAIFTALVFGLALLPGAQAAPFADQDPLEAWANALIAESRARTQGHIDATAATAARIAEHTGEGFTRQYTFTNIDGTTMRITVSGWVSGGIGHGSATFNTGIALPDPRGPFVDMLTFEGFFRGTIANGVWPPEREQLEDRQGFPIDPPFPPPPPPTNGLPPPPPPPPPPWHPAPIISFTATPNPITRGQSTTLSWSSTNATACYGYCISGDCREWADPLLTTPPPPAEGPRIVPPPGEQVEPRLCREHVDCWGLICPMVRGHDTPMCGPDGRCFCGPGIPPELMKIPRPLSLLLSEISQPALAFRPSPSAEKPLSGRQTVTPRITSIYRLECIGLGGERYVDETVVVQQIRWREVIPRPLMQFIDQVLARMNEAADRKW